MLDVRTSTVNVHSRPRPVKPTHLWTRNKSPSLRDNEVRYSTKHFTYQQIRGMSRDPSPHVPRLDLTLPGTCLAGYSPYLCSRFPLRVLFGGSRISARIYASILWWNRDSRDVSLQSLRHLMVRSSHSGGIRTSRRTRTSSLFWGRGSRDLSSRPHWVRRLDPFVHETYGPLEELVHRLSWGDVILETCHFYPTESDDQIDSTTSLTDL